MKLYILLLCLGILIVLTGVLARVQHWDNSHLFFLFGFFLEALAVYRMVRFKRAV